MSLPGSSRHLAVPCRDCGLHFDPEWLVDGLCIDCRADRWRWNVKAERD